MLWRVEAKPGGPGRERVPRGRTALTRWQPALVAALLVVLAVSVALVLAQSAGLIHLGFLGGTGGVSPPSR